MKIDLKLNKNIEYLEKRLGIDKSFDVIGKKILVGDRLTYLLMIDGFVKDQIMLFIIERLQNLDIKDMKVSTISEFVRRHIAYVEVALFDTFEQMEEMMLSGAIAIFFDGETSGIVIDAREYPVRSVNEPELEKVTRGPRDGFVETLIFNTTLVRRRIKDPNLRFELKVIGRRSKTNIAVSYIDDLVNHESLEEIKKRLNSIDVDSLLMAEKSLSELLVPKQWYNPLPKFRYTERPDVAASHLLEGHILIMVDTSPSVIILPTTIFHFTQHADDYYHTPLVGSYIRHIRMLAIFTSYILAPLWFLFVTYSNMFPSGLQFLIPDATSVSLAIELILIELGLDLLKISSINTPSSLSMPLGIMGGLALGEYGIRSGILTPQTILIMAIVGVCSFATPSIELEMGIKTLRMFLLLMTIFFNIPGFIIGNLIVFLLIWKTKNGTRVSYLYPLIPFNYHDLKKVLFRLSVPSIEKKNKPKNRS